MAYAKANPGKLSYGHGNSTGHIVGEAIKKRTGIDMARVPYTATPAAITDLIGGRTQMVVSDLLSGIPQIQAGKVVPLATVFRERSSLLPELPTLHETVMPGFEVLPWLGLFGPANLPADIVMMLSDNLRTILARSDVVARIGTMGIEPYYAPSQETAAFVRADLPRWREMERRRHRPAVKVIAFDRMTFQVGRAEAAPHTDQNRTNPFRSALASSWPSSEMRCTSPTPGIRAAS